MAVPGGGEEARGLSGLVERAADAEVGDLHAALAGDHHVLGLHVPVDDPAARGVLEPRQEPLEHAADLREGELADSGRSEPRSMYSIEM